MDKVPVTLHVGSTFTYSNAVMLVVGINATPRHIYFTEMAKPRGQYVAEATGVRLESIYDIRCWDVHMLRRAYREGRLVMSDVPPEFYMLEAWHRANVNAVMSGPYTGELYGVARAHGTGDYDNRKACGYRKCAHRTCWMPETPITLTVLCEVESDG